MGGVRSNEYVRGLVKRSETNQTMEFIDQIQTHKTLQSKAAEYQANRGGGGRQTGSAKYKQPVLLQDKMSWLSLPMQSELETGVSSVPTTEV